jgi:hypothetical protein
MWLKIGSNETLDVNWILIAQDRIQGRAVVDTVMNIRVPDGFIP